MLILISTLIFFMAVFNCYTKIIIYKTIILLDFQVVSILVF